MKTSDWIVSPKWDLCFFIGSVLFTYLYYGTYKLLLYLPEDNFLHIHAALLVTLVFYSFFDHPHIFQTFSRTHADSQEFSRRRSLYTYGILLFIVAGYCIKGFHFEHEFEFFINVYGIWHILRQNSGFLKLYKKRSKEHSPTDKVCDFGLLYGSVFLFLAIRLSDQNRPLLEWIPPLPCNPDHFRKLFGAILIIYGLRQFYLFKRGQTHIPKLLFLLAIISTYYFTYVISDPPFGLLVVLETLYHDIQYQGWIIHFQQQRFELNRWRLWLISSLLYGVTFGALLLVSIKYSFTEWLLPPFIMLVLFHYFIDGKIWHFSKSPELKEIYKLN